MNRKPSPPVETTPRPAAEAPTLSPAPFPRSAAPDALAEPGPAPSETTSNLFQRLAAGEVDFQLTSEQWAQYLRQAGTNVESLLATQRKDYIKLAAELFPNDPRVQYAVVARDVFPEARREWLDRFKQSAPDNALAAFLSAGDYLKAGDRENGLKDLAEAARRPRYDDYTMEQVQNMEDAQLSAGRGLAEAKLVAGSGLLLPQLAPLRGLAKDVQKIQQEYVVAGDAASAEALAQMGRALSQQLSAGDGSRCLINQLVGVAIERLLLDPLPADSEPAFLNGTVQQRLDEMAALRQNVRGLVRLFDPMLARGDEMEIIGYFDRLKVQGEYKALLWLQNRNNLR